MTDRAHTGSGLHVNGPARATEFANAGWAGYRFAEVPLV